MGTTNCMRKFEGKSRKKFSSSTSISTINMSGMFDNDSDGNRRAAAETSDGGTFSSSRDTDDRGIGRRPDEGMLSNTSDGANRSGNSGEAGMFNNTSEGAARGGGAGMFDNSGDTETRPGNNAGMFDNSGASETRTGGGAGMFDNTGDGNKNLEAREHGEKEKGVKGMLHKAKQAFVPKPE